MRTIRGAMTFSVVALITVAVATFPPSQVSAAGAIGYPTPPPPGGYVRHEIQRQIVIQTHALGGNTYIDCGYITCTIWFNKEDSRELDYQLNVNYASSKHAAVSAVAALICSPLGWGAAVCAGTVAVVYWHLRDTAEKSTREGSCMYIRYTRTAPSTVTGWGTWTNNGQQLCK